MYVAYMSVANMYGANMSGADMTRINLSGVIGLETVKGLSRAIFRQTIVGEKEKEIIEKARKNLELFDVRA